MRLIGGKYILNRRRNQKSLINVNLTCPPKTDPRVMLAYWIEGRQGDEQEAVHIGADHREAAGSRGSPGTGGDGGPGLPYPGDWLSRAENPSGRRRRRWRDRGR